MIKKTILAFVVTLAVTLVYFGIKFGNQKLYSDDLSSNVINKQKDSSNNLMENFVSIDDGRSIGPIINTYQNINPRCIIDQKDISYPILF